jgi:hypothetical protein
VASYRAKNNAWSHLFKNNITHVWCIKYML